MSNSSFSFKQFTICQEKCAMKVGTDGVLLGAWAPVRNARHILDVGTGTGLIALMMAQRTSPDVRITALEIDPDAAAQAKENADASPWRERIEVIANNFNEYKNEHKFDLIVSNPPYFVESLKCPDGQRNTARHTSDELNYEILMGHSASLIAPYGIVAVVVPAEVEACVEEAAWAAGLALTHKTSVITKMGKTCKRLLLAFTFAGGQGSRLYELYATRREDVLCMMTPDGEYTTEYKELTGDFYLK